MENIKLACSEVYCLLEILGDTYKNKLPNKFLEFIDQNRNPEFSLEINENDYENLKISKDGLVLISFLNLNFWVKDENEKQRLIEIYKRNDEIKKEKLSAYQNPDWLSQTNKKENQIITNEKIESISLEKQGNIEKNNSEEKSLSIIEKVSLFDKIKNIIKKFLKK